jgi:hypothetical protein
MAGDANFQGIADYTHRVRRRSPDCRQPDGFAIAHIEVRPMPGTHDLIAFQLAIPQRTVIVRAYIADGVKLPGKVEDNNLGATDLDE